MTRSLTFDRTEVLDKAMMHFWAFGYGASSMQDLLSAMNINRGSLYSTYGDKRALYIESLERYKTLSFVVIERLLDDQDELPKTLQNFFNTMILNGDKQQKQIGCFVVNTIIELSKVDPELSQVAAKGMTKVRSYFEKLFTNAKKKGELSSDHDPKALALFYVNCIHGLRVSAKQGMSKEKLQQIVNTAIHVIR